MRHPPHHKIHGRMCPRKRAIDFRRPCWDTYYWLGIEASKHLDPLKSYREIGLAVGLSKHNTLTAAMIALGKVVWKLRALTHELHAK